MTSATFTLPSALVLSQTVIDADSHGFQRIVHNMLFRISSCKEQIPTALDFESLRYLK